MMFFIFFYSLNTHCYDSGGKFVTKLPTNTTKCDNGIDTCNRIGELNTVIFSLKIGLGQGSFNVHKRNIAPF